MTTRSKSKRKRKKDGFRITKRSSSCRREEKWWKRKKMTNLPSAPSFLIITIDISVKNIYKITLSYTLILYRTS